MDNATQLANQNNGLTQAKRKLEGTINTMQEEAEDLENEAKNADDRAKKAAIEVREDSTRRVDSVTEGPTFLFLVRGGGGGGGGVRSVLVSNDEINTARRHIGCSLLVSYKQSGFSLLVSY